MRYFFYIFYAFFAFFYGANPSFASQEEELSLKEIVNEFDSATEHLSENADKGDLILTDFGSIQIFCADSGTDNLNYAKFVLNVNIAPETTLQNPVLTITDSENIKKSSFFYPVSRPLDPQKGLSYRLKVAFPFFVVPQDAGKAISLTLSFSALWCKNNVCKPVVQETSFTLNAGKNYFSVYSDFIMRAFDFIPSEAEEKQIIAHALNDNTFWVKVRAPSKIKENPVFVLLNEQNQPILYTLEYEKIQKNQGLFVLKTEKNVKNFRLLVQTDYAVLSQNLSLTISPMPEVLFDEEPIKSLPIYLWIFFICFSPTLVLLFNLNFKNEVFVRKKITTIIFQIVLGILSGILIYKIWPYVYLAQSKLWVISCLLLFAYLVCFEKEITPFACGVLTAIVPYFAFFEVFSVPIPETTKSLSIFFIKLTFLNVFPFVLLLIKPIWAVRLSKLSNQMQENVKKYPLYLNLILFVYLIFMLYFQS